ncbi:MAG: methyltransferase [Bacteroidota bacterium]|nr:methyltransferase [Bacteroidota bacterium]
MIKPQAFESKNSVKVLNKVLDARYANIFYLLIKLDIPQLLNKAPMSLKLLAKNSSTDKNALYRLLRLAKSMGIVEESINTYKLTDYGKALLPDNPYSIQAVIIWIFEWKRKVWDNSLYSIQSGKPAFDKVYGKPLFDFLKENPKAQKLFNEVMLQRTALNAKRIVESFDFKPFKSIADIGGGKGKLLQEIFKKNPTIKATLFDSKSNIDELLKTELSELKDIKLSAGNFFESIPKSIDLYIMKEVLHDWTDDECTLILKNCSEAMHQKSRLLIIEQLIDESKPETILPDLSMLLTTGGQERTKKEYENLLNYTGLIVNKIYDAGGLLKLIEVKKRKQNNS